MRSDVHSEGFEMNNFFLDLNGELISRIENHYSNTPIYGVVMDVNKPRLGPTGGYGLQIRK